MYERKTPVTRAVCPASIIIGIALGIILGYERHGALYGIIGAAMGTLFGAVGGLFAGLIIRFAGIAALNERLTISRALAPGKGAGVPGGSIRVPERPIAPALLGTGADGPSPRLRRPRPDLRRPNRKRRSWRQPIC